MFESLEKKKNIFEIDSVELLKEILEKNNINTSIFGKENAKRLEDLFNEIKNKETELVKEGDSIFRRINALSISVNYKKGEKSFVLVEDRQVFSDGRERKRTPMSSLSEKLKSGEDIDQEINRALSEELGIKNKYDGVFIEEVKEEKESGSYPGLLTEYCFLKYKIYLEDEDFKEEGYIENEESTGLTTYFVWKEIK